MRTPKELIELSELMKTGTGLPGFIDNKTYCTLEEMTTLLAENSRIKKLNEDEGYESTYITEVNYKGYNFITVNNSKI